MYSLDMVNFNASIILMTSSLIALVFDNSLEDKLFWSKFLFILSILYLISFAVVFNSYCTCISIILIK